jgi:hypothetical protein
VNGLWGVKRDEKGLETGHKRPREGRL